MEIKSIVDAVLSLNRVLSRTASGNKGGLTLRIQVLLALKKHKNEITVKEIFDHVKIAKTNLAILCNNMCNEGVIEKVKDQIDMRAIKYKLLDKGEQELNKFLTAGQKCFENILSDKEQQKLQECSETICNILN